MLWLEAEVPPQAHVFELLAPGGGTVLGSCGTFGMESLAGECKSLAMGLKKVTAVSGAHLSSLLPGLRYEPASATTDQAAAATTPSPLWWTSPNMITEK